MMVNASFYGKLWFMAKFSCIREALSFVDGGNTPFIGLLFLIGERKQVNASR